MQEKYPTREYGGRYDATASLTELPVLAERILADLGGFIVDLYHQAADSLWKLSDGIPCRFEKSIHVEKGGILRLYIAGIPDGQVFASIATDKYSDWANSLICQLSETLELYNWRNLQDLSDQRFKASIVLVSEDDHRDPSWTTGVVHEI